MVSPLAGPNRHLTRGASLALWSAVALAGCGGGNGVVTPPPPPPPPPATTITLSTASVTFTGTVGQATPPTQQVQVGASQGALNSPQVVIGSGSEWLTADLSGSTLAIGVSQVGLSAGTRTGSLTLSATNAASRSLGVTYQLLSPPVIHFQPAGEQLLQAQVGGGLAERMVTLSNGSGGTLTAVQVTPSTVPWLARTLAGNSLTLAANPALAGAAGDYTASLTLSATGAADTVVPIRLRLTAEPVLTASPGGATFGWQIGNPAPPGQPLVVSRSDGATLGPLTALPSAPWLMTTLAGNTLTVAVLTQFAPTVAGTYPATITLTTPGLTAIVVPVTLQVTGSVPTIGFDVSEIAATARRSYALPSLPLVNVLNLGGGSLVNLRVANPLPAWISATLNGSSLVVVLDQAQAPVGQNEAVITIEADNAPAAQLPVRFTVQAAITSIQLDLPAGMIAGQRALPQATIILDGEGLQVNDVPLVWVSSAPSVVRVENLDGMVLAQTGGLATISASTGGVTGAADIIVRGIIAIEACQIIDGQLQDPCHADLDLGFVQYGDVFTFEPWAVLDNQERVRLDAEEGQPGIPASAMVPVIFNTVTWWRALNTSVATVTVANRRTVTIRATGVGNSLLAATAAEVTGTPSVTGSLTSDGSFTLQHFPNPVYVRLGASVQVQVLATDGNNQPVYGSWGGTDQWNADEFYVSAISVTQTECAGFLVNGACGRVAGLRPGFSEVQVTMRGNNQHALQATVLGYEARHFVWGSDQLDFVVIGPGPGGPRTIVHRGSAGTLTQSPFMRVSAANGFNVMDLASIGETRPGTYELWLFNATRANAATGVNWFDNLFLEVALESSTESNLSWQWTGPPGAGSTGNAWLVATLSIASDNESGKVWELPAVPQMRHVTSPGQL